MQVTGAAYVAEFLARNHLRHIFTLTGGACAFLVDAVAAHADLDLVCVQNEQAAAMAADAIWRVKRRVGVTLATSGPGATNLITGIASSYFDSIPSLHITGQVNQQEARTFGTAKLRQTGFQETKIVEMVLPITKYAVKVTTTDQLRDELAKAYAIATSGRMGPVLIDIPMDVQQMTMEADYPDFVREAGLDTAEIAAAAAALRETLATARRPVVLWGGGVAMAGVETEVLTWLDACGLPFVCSWAGLTSFDHDHPGFVGQIGVYGNRGANFVVQNADTVIVLGSRLDNRQRSGAAQNFAREAVVHVIDVDIEELKKYGAHYRTTAMNLIDLPRVIADLPIPSIDAEWLAYVASMKETYFGMEVSASARHYNSLSPYDVVRRLGEIVDPNAIVAADTGASVCWLHQAFKVKDHTLFTAGGNSPMGYALCAAIGAKIAAPERQVVSYNGDGGFQLNIQELQTIVHLGLDIAIIVMNNGCYGIIKQFQDSYLGSRYPASRDGYSVPDFGKVVTAYGLAYARIERIEDLQQALLTKGAIVIDVALSEHTLIEPKLEMGRPINDQYPYLDNAAYARGNKYVAYPRPDTFLRSIEKDLAVCGTPSR